MRAKFGRLLLMIFLGYAPVAVSQMTEQRLIALLSDEKTWPLAADEVKHNHGMALSLLNLAKRPPLLDPVTTNVLRRGAVELFGDLRIHESIPFLVENIEWQG